LSVGGGGGGAPAKQLLNPVSLHVAASRHVISVVENKLEHSASQSDWSTGPPASSTSV
jgi:hypothetical protein